MLIYSNLIGCLLPSLWPCTLSLPWLALFHVCPHDDSLGDLRVILLLHHFLLFLLMVTLSLGPRGKSSCSLFSSSSFSLLFLLGTP